MLGTVIGTGLFGLSNDVDFQAALLTVVGLAAKNAILIVEFARALQDRGMQALGIRRGWHWPNGRSSVSNGRST